MVAKQWAKREQTYPMCYMQSKTMKRWRALIHRNDYETSKKWTDKRKQTCPVCFVKVIKFQENKFNIIQKSFYEIMMIIKK